MGFSGAAIVAYLCSCFCSASAGVFVRVRLLACRWVGWSGLNGLAWAKFRKIEKGREGG